ncbi:MAG: DUF3467 domain-containing protein [Defluviitaleaceae bacterium]|nr:DUF3467 domain-containing protein [Defluviitaleaceae bacterium]
MHEPNLNYANYVEVKWSPVDFKLIFANQTTTAGGEAIDLHGRTYLSVSPHLAKQLLHVLNYTVQQYENSVGTINVPLPNFDGGQNK